MEYKIKRQIKKLGNKQIADNIKRYITSSHEFYHTNVPEIRTMGKKLHEEHSLESFYRVFNRLWKSGSVGEASLAIYTLQLYKEDFNLKTWIFLKPKLKQIKSWDQADAVSKEVIGQILLRNPGLEKEIVKLGKSRSNWEKRMALMSTLPLVEKEDIRLAMKIIKRNLRDKEPPVQKAIGMVLAEINKFRPELVKETLLKNKNLPVITFDYATKNMKELRKVNQAMENPYKRRFLFWR